MILVASGHHPTTASRRIPLGQRMAAVVKMISFTALLTLRGPLPSRDRAVRLAMPGGRRREEEASVEGDQLYRAKQETPLVGRRRGSTSGAEVINETQNTPSP